MLILYGEWLSHNAVKKRNELLKGMLGDQIVIFRCFPIGHNYEKVVQGALKYYIQSFREMIAGDGWLYIQITNRSPRLTLFEKRTVSVMNLFARELKYISPTIYIRNNRNKSTLMRANQSHINSGELVWCEAEFDKDHNIYNEPGTQIDTLSILTPEVLEVIKDAPGDADILIKRNQLYYMLSGSFSAERILKDLIEHSDVASKELEDNLKRWSRSKSNLAKLQTIHDSELSVTLVENYKLGTRITSDLSQK